MLGNIYSEVWQHMYVKTKNLLVLQWRGSLLRRGVSMGSVEVQTNPRTTSHCQNYIESIGGNTIAIRKPSISSKVMPYLIKIFLDFNSFWICSVTSINFQANMIRPNMFKVHITPLTKFRPENPCGVKRSNRKSFRNQTWRFPTIKLF